VDSRLVASGVLRLRAPPQEPAIPGVVRIRYLVTRGGVGRVPGYYQLNELTDLLETLGLSLADLREVGADMDADTV
jgi:hypothetical protein